MRLRLLIAACVLAWSCLVQAAPPALPIEKALRLAQDYLQEKGLAAAHHVGGITLEDSTIFGGEKFWFARWVPAIRIEQKSEAGVRVNMDGSLVRLVSGASNRQLPPGPRNR